MKAFFLSCLMTLTCLVAGCAKTEMDAPCTQYGKYCSQTLINPDELM